MFILSQKVLSKIDSLRPTIVNDLAIALSPCSGSTINRYLRENQINGDLTKPAATEVLREKTGLKLEEILVKVKRTELQT